MFHACSLPFFPFSLRISEVQKSNTVPKKKFLIAIYSLPLLVSPLVFPFPDLMVSVL